MIVELLFSLYLIKSLVFTWVSDRPSPQSQPIFLQTWLSFIKNCIYPLFIKTFLSLCQFNFGRREECDLRRVRKQTRKGVREWEFFCGDGIREVTPNFCWWRRTPKEVRVLMIEETRSSIRDPCGFTGSDPEFPESSFTPASVCGFIVLPTLYCHFCRMDLDRDQDTLVS